MTRLPYVLIFALILSSCSVYMAGKKEGVCIEEVTQCKTKACLSSKGAEPIDSKRDENGVLIETYKFRKATGSTARAAMHGILDVVTLGIWEVAGTPIEGSKGKKQFIVVKVTYEKDDETIKSIELVQ
ncbi:MAG: hypothetical protein JRJ29_11535 [Deltaproteobacteria bacterium]|nr:hypothetical protein [Deltaproteobacteria bacterium]